MMAKYKIIIIYVLLVCVLFSLVGCNSGVTQAEHTEIQSRYSVLRAEFNQLQIQLNSSQIELRTLQFAHSELKRQYDNLQTEYDLLREQLDAVISQNATRSFIDTLIIFIAGAISVLVAGAFVWFVGNNRIKRNKDKTRESPLFYSKETPKGI